MRLLSVIALIALVAHMLPAAAQETAVDLELALAVDASFSVSDEEYALQMRGIAYAFRDAAVLSAIESGPLGSIAVALVVWAEAHLPKDFSGWHLIASANDADAFASLVETYPRRLTGGTGIGEGLAKTISSFMTNGFTAPRRVIDVSGDGEESTPRDFVVVVSQARAMADAHGVTVNGLAILNEAPDLDLWYREHVQTGPGSFVMSVADYQGFAEAMQRKLLREIENLPRVSSR